MAARKQLVFHSLKHSLAIALLLMFAGIAGVQAQPGKRLRNNPLYSGYNSIGELSYHFGIGASHYFGDVSYDFTQYSRVLYTRPYMQFGLAYRFHERFAARLQTAIFQFRGGDQPETPNSRRGINFTSENTEVTLLGFYDFIPQNKGTRIKFSPYLMAGIGFNYFRVRTQDKLGNWYSVRSLELEGVAYRPITPVFPIGGGVRYRIRRELSIGIEASYRFTLTDYLDGVSTNYDVGNVTPELREFINNSNEGSRVLTGGQRGNSGSRDGYFSGQVFVEIKPFRKTPATKKYRSRRRPR
jgi:opacity protein-like surface antigen